MKMGAWRPESGNSPNGDYALVDFALFDHYHRCRRQISQEWRGAGVTASILDGAVQATMRAAYDELHAQMRQLAPSFPPNEMGTYLIPV